MRDQFIKQARRIVVKVGSSLVASRESGLCPERIEHLAEDITYVQKGGREVLAEVKADSELMHIPVVVFSSSSAPPDVTGAYRLHANCYVTKPADLNELFKAVSWIEKFWLGTATLPRTAEAA